MNKETKRGVQTRPAKTFLHFFTLFITQNPSSGILTRVEGRKYNDMNLLLLNIIDADPGASVNRELILAFVLWVYKHIDRLHDEAQRQNIEL